MSLDLGGIEEHSDKQVERAPNTVITVIKLKTLIQYHLSQDQLESMEPLPSVASIHVLMACSKHVHKQDDVRQ